MKNFDSLLKLVADHPPCRLAVAAAQDHTVLEAIRDAEARKLIQATLFGDRSAILEAGQKVGYQPNEAAVVHEPDPVRAALGAVAMASKGEADMVMKGYIHTDDFLRAILNKEVGLRSGSIMSHVFIAENRALGRLLFIADGAMNIAPDLEQKAAILLNTVYLANAISELAAKHKKITGSVAGWADVLLVPNIEAGNMLAKALAYLGGCRLAGLLVGAKVPVVLTSRADSAESKLLSIASAVFTVNLQRTLWLKVGKVHY